MRSKVAERMLENTSQETKDKVRTSTNAYMRRVRNVNQAQEAWDKIDAMTEEQIKRRGIEQEMRKPIEVGWKMLETAPSNELVEVMDAAGNIAKATYSKGGWLMKFDSFGEMKNMGTVLVWRPIK